MSRGIVNVAIAAMRVHTSALVSIARALGGAAPRQGTDVAKARELDSMGLAGSIRRLLVPVKGTPGDERVLEFAAQFAGKIPVSVTLIYVVEVSQSMPLDAELPGDIAHGERVLHACEQRAKHYQSLGAKFERISTELLQARSAGAAIVDEAIERGSDAILMAARIRRRHGKTTSGESVSYVMKNAPCEVVIVRLAPTDQSLGGLWPT